MRRKGSAPGPRHFLFSSRFENRNNDGFAECLHRILQLTKLGMMVRIQDPSGFILGLAEAAGQFSLRDIRLVEGFYHCELDRILGLYHTRKGIRMRKTSRSG